MAQLILILDNLRSAANVGSILRTCDAAGVEQVICCGTTPYPRLPNDNRDPVVINRNTREIAKTALGAETTIPIEYISDPIVAIRRLQDAGRTVYALEQAPTARSIFDVQPTLPAAAVVGNEVGGISQNVLRTCNEIVEIPQTGAKESLNVAVATGVLLYQLFYRL